MGIINRGPNKQSHRDRGRGNSARRTSVGGIREHFQGGRLVRGTGKGPQDQVLRITHISTDGGMHWRAIDPKEG